MTNEDGMPWEWIKGMQFSRVITIAMVMVMAGGLVAYLCKSKEPSYEGRTLTWWLERDQDVGIAAWGRQSVEPDGETCKRAIQSMGTNTIPFLLNYLTAKDNRFERKLRTLLGPRYSYRFGLRDPMEWQVLASIGFHELGTNAVGATPALMQLGKSDDYLECSMALSALRDIHPGEKYTAVLIQLFEDTNNPARAEAGFALSMHNDETAEKVGVFKAFPKTGRVKKFIQ